MTGKMIVTKKQLKEKNKITVRDKDTGSAKVHYHADRRGNIKMDDEDLKLLSICLLDKIVIAADKEEDEEEIGTVNDFYEEKSSEEEDLKKGRNND